MKMRKHNVLSVVRDFPGGTVDRNLPVNVGEMGSVSSLGGFHMPPEQLRPCATTPEPML